MAFFGSVALAQPSQGYGSVQVDHTLVEEINLLHAQMCRGLADPTRILILYSLGECSRHVNELAEALGVSQPTISRHLKVLRDRGLVTATREGNAMCYALRDRRVIQALDLLREVMADVLTERAEVAEAMTQ
jgi:ArsR family transcriptional regulator